MNKSDKELNEFSEKRGMRKSSNDYDQVIKANTQEVRIVVKIKVRSKTRRTVENESKFKVEYKRKSQVL